MTTPVSSQNEEVFFTLTVFIISTVRTEMNQFNFPSFIYFSKIDVLLNLLSYLLKLDSWFSFYIRQCLGNRNHKGALKYFEI